MCEFMKILCLRVPKVHTRMSRSMCAVRFATGTSKPSEIKYRSQLDHSIKL